MHVLSYGPASGRRMLSTPIVGATNDRFGFLCVCIADENAWQRKKAKYRV